jgi:hypothetical protein
VLLEKRAKIESLDCKLWDSLTFEPWMHFVANFCRSVEYLTYYNFCIHTFTFSSLILVLWLCEYKCPSPSLGFVSHYTPHVNAATDLPCLQCYSASDITTLLMAFSVNHTNFNRNAISFYSWWIFLPTMYIQILVFEEYWCLCPW